MPSGGDKLHFSASSYSEFGKRYTETMLSILEKQGENDYGKDDALKDGPNPNFHIYLAFGQSKLDGAGEIEDQDLIVSERFKMMLYRFSVNLCTTLMPWNFWSKSLWLFWKRISRQIARINFCGNNKKVVPGASIDIFVQDLC